MTKSNLKLFSLIVACILCLTLFTSCKKATLTIEQPTEIHVGDTVKLEITKENLDVDFTWSSSDNTILTVTDDGTVTALKEGEVTIKVVAGNKKKTEATINIVVKPERLITFSNPKTELFVLDETTLTVVYSLGNATFKWESSDQLVATVDSLGHVKALKTGRVTIKVSLADNASIYTTIELVIAEVPEITLNNVDTELLVGNNLQVIYQTKGEVGTISFTSSDETVASITSDGTITALKKGTTTITIVSSADNKLNKTFTLTVDDVPEIILNQTDTSKLVGETLTTNYFTKGEVGTISFTSSDETVASVDTKGNVTALKKGTTTITIISSVDNKLNKTFTLTVDDVPEIILNQTDTSKLVGETLTINYFTKGEVGTISFTSSDETVASITSNGVITAFKKGITTITVVSSIKEELNKTFTLTVDDVPEITFITEATTLSLPKDGDALTFTVLYETKGNVGSIIFTSSNTQTATINNNGVLTILKEGTTTIKATSSLNSNLFDEVVITVLPKDEEAPVISLLDGAILDMEVMYNEPFNPLLTIVALDNYDGDITDKVEVTGTVNHRIIGTYPISYQVTDKAGNVSNTLTRNIKVVWNSSLTFIGHGGSYSGIMNTEEAFLNAILVHSYQALECDVKQTKDGVFVVCHDDKFAGVALASTNYADLKDVEYTLSRGGISYTSKICTFARYLDICKQYNVKAVVELKSSAGITNSDQSRMQALLNVITDKGMLNEVIFLGSQYKCLEWVKSNGYEYIPCQYLVNSCESTTVLNRCIEWDFDLSFNIDSQYANSVEWINRYKDEGLKVSAWTFNQYTTVKDLQNWINKDVLDYVTVDKTLPWEVTLPPKGEDPDIVRHTVTFVDYDNKILKISYPKDGKTAVSPVDPIRDGYTFTGWDIDYKNVTSDLTVKALYTPTNYSVTFDSSLYELTSSTWTDKASFTAEFYNDFFNWLKTRVGKIPGLVFAQGQYTLTMNGKTSSWTDGPSLMQVDIYTVELCQGHFIYKPVTRTNNQPVEPEIDENYFLNSLAYRDKYQALDAYFLNAATVGYPAYNRNYQPNSGKKIQIFFRFQQWAKGTNIASFNTLPVKYTKEIVEVTNLVMPDTLTYTVEQEVTLDIPTCDGYEFIGWYKSLAFDGDILTKIEKGTTGNFTLYAKWKKISE